MKSLLVPVAMMIAAPAFAVESGKSFYIETSGGVTRLSAKAVNAGLGTSEKSTDTFAGGGLGAGMYFGEGHRGYHQLGLEFGMSGHDENAGGIKQSDLFTTTLVVYNYNFKLPRNVGVVYAGVSGGMAYYNADLENGVLGKSNFYDSNFAGGVQAGARFRIVEHVALGVGYRFLAVCDMKDDVYGADVRLRDVLAHEFKVGVTVSF